MSIPYLKPKPNWGRIKFSDSFIFEMFHWGQSFRHNFKTGIITFYQYDKSGNLTTYPRIVNRSFAIDVLKSYVTWMNRINDHLEWKMTSFNQQPHAFGRR